MRAPMIASLAMAALPAPATAATTHWAGGGEHVVVDFLVDERDGDRRVIDALFQYVNVRPECRWKSAVSFGNGAFVRNGFRIRRPGGSSFGGFLSDGGIRGDVVSAEANGCPPTVFGWTAHRVSAPFLRDGPWTGHSGGLALSFDVLHGGRVIGDVRGELACDGVTAPFHGKYRNSIIGAGHRFRVALPGRHPSYFNGTFFADAVSAQGYVRKITHQGCDSSWRGWRAAPR
jgi:hypothetical protein